MKSGTYLLLILTMVSNLLPLDMEYINSFIDVNKIIEIEEDIQTDVQNSLQISLVGDLLMDGSVRTQIDKNGMDYPWNMVKEYFQKDDITIGNLETSITNRGTKWKDKQFNFRSDPRNLKYMKDAGIDILSLANNHILDYGYDGLLDTLEHIDNNGIQRVGAGKNKDEAMKGLIIDKEGLKIGILSASRVVPDVKWYATDKRPGLVGAYDSHIEQLLKNIEEMKKEVDVLLLSIHWGVELSPEPREQEVNLAKKLIDGGVDIIIGHHPHVLQGIEIYKGKPIFYSLGNFVFSARNELTTNTIIAQVNFIDGEIDNIQIIPCKIQAGKPVPLIGDLRMEKISYMNKISNKFGVKADKEGIIKVDDY